MRTRTVSTRNTLACLRCPLSSVIGTINIFALYSILTSKSFRPASQVRSVPLIPCSITSHTSPATLMSRLFHKAYTDLRASAPAVPFTKNTLPKIFLWLPPIIHLSLKLLSHVQLFVTPRTIQSMEFSRPEYWSG